MKLFAVLFLLCVCQLASAQDLRSILLDQLKSTHNNKDWFVPANIAVEGVTAEQASWKDATGAHSVGQLAYHLVFWNERALAEFKDEKVAKYSGNNEETFDSFDKNAWNDVVKRLDAVMVGIEKFVAEANEAKLKEIASTVSKISAHNAYHTGQIIVVRKLQKSWDPKKGVN